MDLSHVSVRRTTAIALGSTQLTYSLLTQLKIFAKILAI